MTALAPAFADPVTSAQSVFRNVMEAFARPGTPRGIAVDLAPPSPLSPAAAAVALTLLDYETPVWLDSPLAAGGGVAKWITFHTGAPVTADKQEAAFAFMADARRLPPFEGFALGTMEYPDRSTTLVVQVDGFGSGPTLSACGPGISGSRQFSPGPLPDDFAERLSANRALFPRGVDLLFVTADAVAALPRSIRTTQGG